MVLRCCNSLHTGEGDNKVVQQPLLQRLHQEVLRPLPTHGLDRLTDATTNSHIVFPRRQPEGLHRHWLMHRVRKHCSRQSVICPTAGWMDRMHEVSAQRTSSIFVFFFTFLCVFHLVLCHYDRVFQMHLSLTCNSSFFLCVLRDRLVLL